MAKKNTPVLPMPVYTDYNNFLKAVGYGKIDNTDVTHDGYPLSARECKFIDIFVASANLTRALRESHMRMADFAGKDYLVAEIKYRLDLLKAKTIADADEVMQYFTKVMRGEEKDQFGLDAPLGERTAAARELAKRLIDDPLHNEQPQVMQVKLDFCDVNVMLDTTPNKLK